MKIYSLISFGKYSKIHIDCSAERKLNSDLSSLLISFFNGVFCKDKVVSSIFSLENINYIIFFQYSFFCLIIF